MLRETHLKINLDHLEHNVQSIQEYCHEDVILGAVLKANAYGHGAKYISKALFDYGIDHFLVATLVEAVELRRYNKDYKIIVMGHTPDIYLKEVIHHQLIPTLFSLEQAITLNDLCRKNDSQMAIHLKIETGFNRLGMQINDNTVNDIKAIHELSHIHIQGIFTHLALKDKASDMRQFDKFMALVTQLENENVSIPIKHVCDSISMVLYPSCHLNMIRIGALLYGLESEEKGILDVKPVLSMHTKLSHKKQILKGSTLSYGNRWRAKEDTLIGTLPFGYADGYPRNLYQKGQVKINHKFYPIVGVICMDQCMIDLGDDDISFDENVTIIGEDLPVSQIAHLANTNKNEIVCRMALRVPRVYIKNNEIKYIDNPLVGEI